MIDISGHMLVIQSAICEAANFISAPHVRMPVTIKKDGDQWCCLYGENLQEGVAGFGLTPADACAAFDAAWCRP